MLNSMASRIIRYQAAIVRDHRLLLLRWVPDAYPPVWLVPGGGREQETEEECVVREVREETGLACRVLRLLPQISVADLPGPYEILKTFLVDAPDGEPRPGEEPEPGAKGEITEVRWFDLRSSDATSVEVLGTPFTHRAVAQIRDELGYRDREESSAEVGTKGTTHNG